MKRLVVGLSAIAVVVGFSPGIFAKEANTSSFKPVMMAAKASRKFVFNPSQHKWYAYKNGRLVKSGVASGGKKGYRTPRGSFHLQRKGGWSCRSGTYPKPRGGAWMGNCMFFLSKYAIHASHSVPSNYNASHGCIRVKPWAAKWLHKFLYIGDRVVVTSY